MKNQNPICPICKEEVLEEHNKWMLAIDSPKKLNLLCHVDCLRELSSSDLKAIILKDLDTFS